MAAGVVPVFRRHAVSTRRQPPPRRLRLLALLLGVSPLTAIAFVCRGLALLRSTGPYPTLLAAVEMDDTGSTRIGKYVFNHCLPDPPALSSRCGSWLYLWRDYAVNTAGGGLQLRPAFRCPSLSLLVTLISRILRVIVPLFFAGYEVHDDRPMLLLCPVPRRTKRPPRSGGKSAGGKGGSSRYAAAGSHFCSCREGKLEQEYEVMRPCPTCPSAGAAGLPEVTPPGIKPQNRWFYPCHAWRQRLLSWLTASLC